MANESTLSDLLESDGPTCLVIKASLKPVGDLARFQPAGFPEIGHVIYDAPRDGNTTDKVCIIDSAASMANHLESVCMDGPNSSDLHPDLTGLPYVVCVTHRKFEQEGGSIKPASGDPFDKVVVTSLTEGHRIASDYFLDAFYDKPEWKPEGKKKEKGKDKTVPADWEGTKFRERLRKDFGITEVKKDKTYFTHPEDWWEVYKTIFRYDPNSLVHGVLFAKEQIKISRLLTAHQEAFNAARVQRSGVKFDRLGKTLSGQPIFAVDEETGEIRSTFIIDLALLRSYGRKSNGLNDAQKQLLLGLSLWKIKRLLAKPFRFRSGCYLKCFQVSALADDEPMVSYSNGQSLIDEVDIQALIAACTFGAESVTKVYYPANSLFRPGKDDTSGEYSDGEETATNETEQEEED
ncbi:MAG: CRISPR-associated protein [Acidobacteria bacterium]|nr:CRISPR-associated protein [Acidobacteriota bacterium]